MKKIIEILIVFNMLCIPSFAATLPESMFLGGGIKTSINQTVSFDATFSGIVPEYQPHTGDWCHYITRYINHMFDVKLKKTFLLNNSGFYLQGSIGGWLSRHKEVQQLKKGRELPRLTPKGEKAALSDTDFEIGGGISIGGGIGYSLWRLSLECSGVYRVVFFQPDNVQSGSPIIQVTLTYRLF